MSDLLTIDHRDFADGYARRPFRVRHRLAEHPLLSLESLGELADFLPEAEVEHNRADVPEILPSGEVDRLDATPGEIARGIETNGAWMVLKHVETHPDYNALLDEALDEVMPYVAEREGRMRRRAGFIFLTSPGGTTPAHTDPEHNFLLQVRGFKEVTVGLWASKRAQQEELEGQVGPGGHRNIGAMPEGSEAFRLARGDGLYVPIHAPHLVKNGDEVSVSLAITWQTPVSERGLLATSLNARMRRLRLSPRPPGDRPVSDKAKAGLVRAVHRARGSRSFN
jgi:Cupin superfamily protein